MSHIICVVLTISLFFIHFFLCGFTEYGYNSQAQLEYSLINPRWVMPSRYYTKRVLASNSSSTGEVYITMLFLDTSPCIAAYRADNPQNWDPCSTAFPTCSPLATDDDFEGPCNFHQNIIQQSCDDQYAWLLRTLPTVPADDWLVVVGHHPVSNIISYIYKD